MIPRSLIAATADGNVLPVAAVTTAPLRPKASITFSSSSRNRALGGANGAVYVQSYQSVAI